MTGARVLGIDVSTDLLERWTQWFAPDPQPILAERRPGADEKIALSDELRDTFELYGLAARGLSLRWLRETEYLALSQGERAELIRSQVTLGRALVPTRGGQRFLWWPSLLAEGSRVRVLSRFVEGARTPSRHAEVDEIVWSSAGAVLPGARRLAGTFPERSGPNCFGTVMASAGVAGAEEVWTQREEFEAWLAAHARPVRGQDDSAPGVVLLWRDRDGAADHAAVTLGAGWALHKPSQGWMSPTTVLQVPELIRGTRARGLRLHRYRISG